jgi:hypothetical protein
MTRRFGDLDIAKETAAEGFAAASSSVKTPPAYAAK